MDGWLDGGEGRGGEGSGGEWRGGREGSSHSKDDLHSLVIATRHYRPRKVHHRIYPTVRAQEHHGPTSSKSREAYQLDHLNLLDALPRRTSASPARRRAAVGTEDSLRRRCGP